MLNKQRSRKTAILKYGLFLPLFAAMLLLSSATISRNEEIKAVAAQIASPVSLGTAIAGPNNGVFRIVKMNSLPDPKSENDWDAFYKYVSKTIKYPAIARDNELQGNTMIKFSIIQGEISGISTVYTLGLGCDAQAMKAILGYTNFMHVQDGNYTIKIAFRLPDASSKISNPEIVSPKGYTPLPEITVVANSSPAPAVAKTEETTYDYALQTTNPEFPGGMAAFYKYLSEACRYPAEARENHVEGKVLLSFIVEKDGRIADIKVEKGLGSGTDEEAVRLMESSPKWTPGYSGGEPVRVQLNLPVNFSLDHLSSIAIRQAARSNNQPLYVIDGIVQSQPFTSNTLDPNTIESINVIKDAAANTMYGEAGKNGVIMVTTKKGKSRPVPPPPPANNIIRVQIP